MRRKHIPICAVSLGQRVFVLPRGDGIPRGPGLEPLPREGAVLTITEYLFGAIQRGGVTAYEPSECSDAELAEHGASLLAALPDGLRPGEPPAPEPEVE
jgi:hypothetical protein